MKKKLFAIPYSDRRGRKHVVAVLAETPDEALSLVIKFQIQDESEEGVWYYNGFEITPDLDDVEEIQPDENEPVQILWHQDYD